MALICRISLRAGVESPMRWLVPSLPRTGWAPAPRVVYGVRGAVDAVRQPHPKCGRLWRVRRSAAQIAHIRSDGGGNGVRKCGQTCCYRRIALRLARTGRRFRCSPPRPHSRPRVSARCRRSGLLLAGSAAAAITTGRLAVRGSRGTSGAGIGPYEGALARDKEVGPWSGGRDGRTRRRRQVTGGRNRSGTAGEDHFRGWGLFDSRAGDAVRRRRWRQRRAHILGRRCRDRHRN